MREESRAGSDREPAASSSTERQIRHAWLVGILHGVGSALILLATGVNIVLAAHYPLLSAAAVLLLAEGVRRRSRSAAFLLTAGVATPALIKLLTGTLHPPDLPAFVLATIYARGLYGTLRHHRPGPPDAA